MFIMISGPYSAPKEEERQKNLQKINRAAAEVAKKGHIPVVGINAALPIVRTGMFDDESKEIMRISLALAEKCDAILCLGKSKGVDMERKVFLMRDLQIFEDINDIPYGN